MAKRRTRKQKLKAKLSTQIRWNPESIERPKTKEGTKPAGEVNKSNKKSNSNSNSKQENYTNNQIKRDIIKSILLALLIIGIVVVIYFTRN